jgi:hypothetical protein
MTPAELVIHRFKGVRPLARLLKLDHSSVARWPKPKPRGLGGFIPSRLHKDLLQLAATEGVELTANELIYGGEDKPREPTL